MTHVNASRWKIIVHVDAGTHVRRKFFTCTTLVVNRQQHEASTPFFPLRGRKFLPYRGVIYARFAKKITRPCSSRFSTPSLCVPSRGKKAFFFTEKCVLRFRFPSGWNPVPCFHLFVPSTSCRVTEQKVCVIFSIPDWKFHSTKFPCLSTRIAHNRVNSV